MLETSSISQYISSSTSKSHHNNTTGSSGIGSSLGSSSYDPTPDITSFTPHSAGSKNEADRIGIQFRSNKTSSTSDRHTANLASMVSRSVVLNRAATGKAHSLLGIPTSIQEAPNEVVPFKPEETNTMYREIFAANSEGVLFEVGDSPC